MFTDHRSDETAFRQEYRNNVIKQENCVFDPQENLLHRRTFAVTWQRHFAKCAERTGGKHELYL